MQSAVAVSSFQHESRKRHLLEPENAVTFQIVLIGSDGLVVASDRMESYATPGQLGESPAWQRAKTTKYFKSEDASVICFSAGGPLTRDIGRAIASRCRTTSGELAWEESLKSVADEVVRLGQLAPPDEIIVVRNDVLDTAWLVVKHENSLSTVGKVSEWRCTGDNSAARFLPWHLWTKAPVRELKWLAVLALSYASKENPSGVSGWQGQPGERRVRDGISGRSTRFTKSEQRCSTAEEHRRKNGSARNSACLQKPARSG
jgi:hypothetical protein